ncbi:MAG TPA: alginate lyase family protein [Polyangia bacterium]|nr:alginate lyase family protein [Polyangia bacterium]
MTLAGGLGCSSPASTGDKPDGTMPQGGAGSGGSSGGSGGNISTGSGGDGSGGMVGSGGATGAGGTVGSGGAPAPDGGAGSGGTTGGADGGVFAGTFRHPGAMINADQIAFLKMHIAAGDAPWTAGLRQLQSTDYGSASYTPAGGAPPGGIVTCGYISNPDIGCGYEKNVAAGAFANALAWVLTGDKAHAAGAVRILNGWASLMKGRGTPADQEYAGNTGQDFNGILQSGWQGSTLARAAELIRGSDGGVSAGWAAADIAKFQAMVRVGYVPYLQRGYIRTAATDPARLTGGNWDLSAIDGLIQMAVFLEDADLFNKALTLWRRRVPAYIYMRSDGPTPIKIPGDLSSWYSAATTVDGIAEETCRDLSHIQYGFAAMINAAETALIQGVNLYGEQAPRIAAGLELNAKYWLAGSGLPATCAGSDAGNFSSNYIARPTWIVAYNEFADRLKMPMPSVKSVIAQGTSPTADDQHHIQWEALTHSGVGSVGIR